MYSTKLKNSTVEIHAPEATIAIIYPQSWMAYGAYTHIRECCDRFNQEPDLNPNSEPRIYVYGEMCTWIHYIKRLITTVEKIGAKVFVKSEI